jgi:nitroreductase/NAD-dependent dihydropyrimidine dehydrogenase PreA subunit
MKFSRRQKMLIEIDSFKCRKDQLCVIECPFNCLVEGKNGVPYLDAEREQYCMRCGHCVAVCPSAAVTLEGVDPSTLEPAVRYPVIEPQMMKALLDNRRSVRVFRSEPIAREKAAELLDMVKRAPTAKNKLPVEWLLVDDAAKIHRIAELTVEWLRGFGEAQAMVTEAWDAGEDIILREAPLLAMACAGSDAIKPCEDCTIAVTSMELAAATLGIGSFWLGYFMTAAQNYAPLQEFLGLPEGMLPRAALGLGYPKMIYRRLPERKAPVVRWL